MRGGVSLRLLAAAFVGLQPASVRAAEDPQVTVDCPSLGAELVASLEARAKADLLVRGATGTLSVTCREATTLLFTSSASASRVADIPAPADSRASVDAILETLDAMLAEPVSPAPPRSPSRETPPPVASTPTPGNAVNAPASPSFSGVYVGVGAHAELWSSDIGVALGPRVRGRFEFESGLSLSLGAMILFSAKDASSVAGRVERAFAGVDYSFGAERRFALGAELGFDVLHALPAASLGTRVATYTAPMGDAYLAYTWFSGPVRLAAGLHGVVHAGPVKVELGDREVFRIPAFTGGLAVEGVFGPL